MLGVVVLAGAGCGGQALTWEEPVAESYRVRQVDTLYSIAWRNGLDWRELARWNGLRDGTLIYPGQTLRLTPPQGGAPAAPRASPAPAAARPATPGSRATSTPAATVPRITWRWPADGTVLEGFGAAGSVGTGLDIAGRLGEPVRAAADGKVVYAGSGLIGYGKLIIIKHSDTFLSAYGHNRTMVAREGDQVRAGQKIAEIGQGPDKRPMLHFEIRLDGEPVDPIRYLPRRPK